MQWLDGKKVYIIGCVMILLGIGKFFGIDIPGYENVDAGGLINGGLLALGFRSAMNK